MCIVDDGYMWLQKFPTEKNHSVTTMFDNKGNVVQWYIDICFKNREEGGFAWMDDLYLDIIVLPTGEVIQQDANELEEPLLNGSIDKELYDLAWKEANNLMGLINNGEFKLIDLSIEYRELLVHTLKRLVD